MNRFEAMLAPPTLSNKDMAMHVKMQTAISKDEANNYRAEMLVPEVRLFDELTTLRFRRPGPDETSSAYKKFCGMFSGASGSPIPYRFFKGEFEKLMDDMNLSGDERSTWKNVKAPAVRKAVDSISDPWRVQAYAALCARIAEASETEDAKKAAAAWEKAFTLYGRFFSMAGVEQSTTYKLQTEEKFKEDTAAAWNQFRTQLAEGIVSRIKDYIRDGKPVSVAACIDALSSSAVMAVDSTAADRALSDSLIPYVNALKSSNSLNDAAKLYEKIPEQLVEKDTRQECVRAMLSVMSDETDRLQKSGKSVTTLIKWIGKLKVENLYKNGTPLVKKSAGDFYEKCAIYVRDVINGEKHSLAKYADNLVALIPDDVVIARAGDNKELHREDIIGLCTTNRIRSEYMSKLKNCSSESEARNLGRTLYDEIKGTPMVGVPQKEMRRHLMQNLIVTLQQSEMSVPLQLAFLECYPDDEPLMDKDIKTVGDYKRMLPPYRVNEGLQALKDFAEAGDGTEAKNDALRRVIDYALEHPDEDVGGKNYYSFAEACCQNAFIGALNDKDSTPEYTFNKYYKPALVLAASFLPGNHKFPAGSGRTMELGLLLHLLNIDIDSGLRRRADAARKKIGVGGGGGGGIIPPGPFRPHKPRVPSDYYPKVIGTIIARVLVPLLLLGILTLVGHFRHGLPTFLEYLRMLLKISAAFYAVIGLAEGCLNNGTPHRHFWKNIQMQGYLLSVPVAFYFSLKFFHALPMKIWAIILCVIYGIIYLLATIGTLISKD